ncbi:hypothetical protein Tco_1096310 [Tanacetum coccineum]
MSKKLLVTIVQRLWNSCNGMMVMNQKHVQEPATVKKCTELLTINLFPLSSMLLLLINIAQSICEADYCCLLCLFISEHTYVPYWQAYTVLEMNCIEQQSQQLLSLTDSGAPDRKMFGCLKEPNQAS